jgi:Zn ribbon nucleic-acid-binding protein
MSLTKVIILECSLCGWSKQSSEDYADDDYYEAINKENCPECSERMIENI